MKSKLYSFARHVLYGILTASLFSCVTVPPEPTLVLVDADNAAPIARDRAITIEAACLIEMNKITIPNMPSRPVNVSSGNDNGSPSILGGFTAGASQASNYYERQRAREAISEAERQRDLVFEACLLSKGVKATYVLPE